MSLIEELSLRENLKLKHSELQSKYSIIQKERQQSETQFKGQLQDLKQENRMLRVKNDKLNAEAASLDQQRRQHANRTSIDQK